LRDHLKHRTQTTGAQSLFNPFRGAEAYHE
jgi:hypothetical protein